MTQSTAEFQEGGFGPGPGERLEGPDVAARTPRQIFWAKFKQDKLALFGGSLIVIILIGALLAGVFENITGHPFDHQYRELMLNEFGTPQGPNPEFWFGADDLGRDLFVRVLYGARTSLQIAIIATGIEVLIGVTLGMLAGYVRGWVDTVVSRLIDLILSIPFLLLGIALGVVFGGSRMMIILLITFFGWPYIARIVRGQTLSIRESQFIEAARSTGAGTPAIMVREILPNLVAPVLVFATLIIPTNIVAESALSFLGVGIQEPIAAWGTMLARATGYVSYGAAWWYMFYPGLFLFLTVLGFNLLGDGLRDALDPKTRN